MWSKDGGEGGSCLCSCLANSLPDCGRELVGPSALRETLEGASPEFDKVGNKIFPDEMYKIIGKGCWEGQRQQVAEERDC